MVAKIADIERGQAKTINLGLFYGMGRAKLQGQLGVYLCPRRAIDGVVLTILSKSLGR